MRLSSAAQLLILIGLVLLPCVAQAQQSLVRGSWTLDPQQSDDVGVRINEALAGMNYVTRQIARPRMRRTNRVYPRLEIAHAEQNVRLDMAGSPALSSPDNGQPMLWHRETGASCTEVRGECVRVTTEWEDGRLRQTFVAENGQRVNVFSVSRDGGTLTLNVTLSSPHLSAPLNYRLVYNRAA